MNMLRSAAVFLGCCIISASVQASEIRYRPINPSFGGDPFNSSHLLGIASANNKYREPREEFNPLDNVDQLVTSSLISRISSQINDQIFGEDAADSGTFQFGSSRVDFNRVNNVIHITISGPGGSTEIEVPAP